MKKTRFVAMLFGTVSLLHSVNALVPKAASNSVPVANSEPIVKKTMPATKPTESVSNNAANSANSNNVANVINNKLKVALPDLKVDTINQSEVPGVYEVTSGHKVFYVDSTGQYAFLGNLVDLVTKRSVTQKRVDSLSVVNWGQLPLSLAIRHVIGNGERKIAVFTDPECPFCKELEQNTIPKLKNVTVYYFLFPLAMHSNAKLNSQKILCSENPEATFLAWMIKDKALLGKGDCKKGKQTIDLIKQAGAKAGVEATPFIVLPDGTRINGLVPADYLNKKIDDAYTVIKPTSAPAFTSTPVETAKS